jgi:hypothetical protein
VEAKKAETQAAVAEWKENRDRKKLEKRAERAQKYAEACIAMALCAAEEAEVAILEAAAARRDADDALKMAVSEWRNENKGGETWHKPKKLIRGVG